MMQAAPTTSAPTARNNEIAADMGRDHAHLPFGHPDPSSHRVADDVRDLGRAPERDLLANAVREHAPRLHRGGRQSLLQDFQTRLRSVEAAAQGLRSVTLLVILATVDADGTPLFADEDAAALEQKNFQALNRVFKAAIRVNAMSEAEVEGLRKNSLPGRSDVSSSVSPGTSGA